ncbi:MAG: CidA/LrgA family protein [Clostridia bacterium]|nr:CidA/LrgA family protein [Clostridia bacterium]
MKILKQLGGLFLLCIIGEILSALLPFPLPAGVLCMVLLFLGLSCHIIQIDVLRESADFMLKNMAFFFIPASVGIVEYYPLIKHTWLPLLIICILATFATFAATAYTVRLVIFLQTKFRNGGAKK